MHCLLCVVLLASAGPTIDDAPVAINAPASAPVAMNHAPEVVPRHPATLHAFQLSGTPSSSALMVTRLTDSVPYGTVLHDWYQRNRADKQWRNGVGITFTLGDRHRRWTIGLGPIQISFGGRPLSVK